MILNTEHKKYMRFLKRSPDREGGVIKLQCHSTSALDALYFCNRSKMQCRMRQTNYRA